MKKIVIVLGTLFLLGVGSLAALIAFFPKEKALAFFQAKATEAAKTPVKISDIGMSLTPFGLRMTGLQLGDQAEVGKPLVKLAELRVGLKIRPLLQKKIEISEIYLGSPYLEMLQAKPADQEAKPEDSSATSPNPANDFALTLESLRIDKGEVHVKTFENKPFLDLSGIGETLSASVKGSESVTLKGLLTIAELAVHLPAGTLGKGLSLKLDKNLSYNLKTKQLHIEEGKLQLGDLLLALTGDVSNANEKMPSFDVKLSGGPSSVKSILGYLPSQMFPEMAGVSSSGMVSIAGWAKGTPQKPDYNVALVLKDGTLKYPKLPSSVSGIQVDVSATPVLVTINRFDATTGKSSVHVVGTVQNPQKAAVISLKANVKTDIEEVLAMQPSQQKAKASGTVQLSADVSGTQKDPVVKGRVNFVNVSYEDESSGLPALSQGRGTMDLGVADFEVKGLGGKIGKTDFVLDGKLTGLVPYIKETDAAKKQLRFDGKIHSQHLDLDELALAGGKKEDKKKAEKIDTRVLDPFSGHMAVSANEVIFNKMTIKNVTGAADLKRGIFDLKQVALNVFGGAIKLNGLADYTDIKAPKFDVNLALQNIESHELLAYASGLNQFGKMADYLSGKFSTNLALKGSLKEDLSLDMKTLFSKGDIAMASGKITGHPIQNSLAGYLNAEKFKSFEIKEWLQPFEIKDGALNVSNMKMGAKEFEVKIDGKQQLDGSANFAMDFVLPQSLSQGIKSKIPAQAAALLFDGSDSKISLPLNLSGLISSPKFAVNSDKLMSGVKDRATDKLKAEASKLQDRLQEETKLKAETLIKQKLGGSVEQKKDEVKAKIQDEVKKKVGGDVKKNAEEGAKKLFKKLW